MRYLEPGIDTSIDPVDEPVMAYDKRGNKFIYNSSQTISALPSIWGGIQRRDWSPSVWAGIQKKGWRETGDPLTGALMNWINKTVGRKHKLGREKVINHN